LVLTSPMTKPARPNDQKNMPQVSQEAQGAQRLQKLV
jgi:hypothetical protein